MLYGFEPIPPGKFKPGTRRRQLRRNAARGRRRIDRSAVRDGLLRELRDFSRERTLPYEIKLPKRTQKREMARRVRQMKRGSESA